MPSNHQADTSSSGYDSQAEKYLDKPDHVIRRMIPGLRKLEDVNAWLDAEVNGKQRKEVIGLLNERKAELQE